MAPTKTRTIKNKHAGSKSSSTGAGTKGGDKRSAADGVRSRKPKSKGPIVSKQVTGKGTGLVKKTKKKVYTAEELGVPNLNMITPVGVVKPKGKKKGKVFVDDRVTSLPRLPSHPTNLAYLDYLVYANGSDY
jgi:60S ribosomal subunit assembly/export protein LOC1